MTANGHSPTRRARYDRASLLDVAVRVFLERGYDGTSMADLAQAAGITKSSFYHHVPSKEALLQAACDRALDALDRVRRSLPAGHAIEQFEYVLRATIHALVTELPYVTVLLRVRGNTTVERDALRRRREFDRFVADLLGRAAADGALRSDIDPLLATRLVFGLVNSIAEWYRADGRLTADQLGDTVVRLVMDGLRRD